MIDMHTQRATPSTVNKIAAEALKIDGFMLKASGDRLDPYVRPEWHTGLCDCYSEQGGGRFFLIAFCCPCVAYGMNYSLLVTNKSCDISACLGPCCLFVVLEMVNLAAALASGDTGRNTHNTAMDAFTYLTAQHQYAVGKRIGVYSSADCDTMCSIWFESLCCAPCVQARVRNEVVFQRDQRIPFLFNPQPNKCCNFLCCTKDCGCAGCVDAET